QTLSDERHPRADDRTAAVYRRPTKTGWLLRMYPLCLLHLGLPVLVVESGALCGAGGLVTGLALYLRHAGYGDPRTSGRLAGPFQRVPMPKYPELHLGLPQRAEPHESD